MEFFEEGVRKEFEPRKGGGRVGRTGFESLKYKKDPKFLAAYNLNKALEKYPNFTSEARSILQNEFIELPDLAVMNLDLLAAALDFLRKNPSPKPEDFSDKKLENYFVNFLSEKMNSEEIENYKIRFKSYFLKYVVTVQQYRTRGEEFEEE